MGINSGTLESSFGGRDRERDAGISTLRDFPARAEATCLPGSMACRKEKAWLQESKSSMG